MHAKSDPTIKSINNFLQTDASADMHDICRSLDKYGINAFFYSAFIGINRVNLLSNNSDWLTHLRTNLNKYNLRFENQFHFRPGFSIDYLNYFNASQMSKDMIDSGMKNAVYLTNVSMDRKFSEVFIFTTQDHQAKSTPRLAGSINFLNQFCLEFKDKAHAIINNTRLKKEDLDTDEQSQAFIHDDNCYPELKRYYLGFPHDNYYLTHKEWTYLKAYLLGDSCKTIAKVFHVSPRTIETRLRSIKKKMNCEDKGDLLNKVISSQLCYQLFMREF